MPPAASRISTSPISACQIACQIPKNGAAGGFDPNEWMEPKEQRKVDDFIVYAMSAATQALGDAGWKPDA